MCSLLPARAQVLALLLALRDIREQPGRSSARWMASYDAGCGFGVSFSSPFTTSMTWLCTSCHSVSRSQERNCSLHQPRSFARDRCARCSSQARHSFSKDRKSDCSSRNSACFWSAWVCLSAGRSRGSGTDSAAAMMATSSRQFSFAPASSMRPRPGSSGRRASRRPISVIGPSSDSAPSSMSVRWPSRTSRPSGGSTKGKASMSPSRSACICRITAARLVRWISGSVNAGRPR